MKLGLNFGQDFLANPHSLLLAQEAERLGFSVCWAAEAYGSDSVSVLGWLAAHTSTIDLGSSIMQIPARTPAMTAMTAATLDLLSNGRFRLGLGPSGPQVTEGWHGVRSDHPLARIREYVGILEQVWRRDRVSSNGPYYPLPLPDGPGKPLKLIIRPRRERIPLYLAATGPKAIELAGEIADGWHALFFSPDQSDDALSRIRAGRRTSDKDLNSFDVVATVPIAVDESLDTAADQIREYVALYVGGMGSRSKNYYNETAIRMGFGKEAKIIQDRYLGNDKAGAGSAVPLDLIDRTSLVGTEQRIAQRMKEFAAAGVTTLALKLVNDTAPLGAQIHVLRTAVRAWERSGTAE
ncbi:F420-dependent glucose-6-phosphate dehydrogenase [Rhodococcus erythropolis]|uniref:LLM class F420-dependent oxidoreductase n=1 Tax=Rhodococcus erythropolis TaxID=1833 RepID=UPI001C0EF0B1|nr:LLM class F420-dependent oxidoreductase [Rhodococcus erythropolis]PBI91948.1 F420-dependent glucose-6-phosphate dehydrogenase [Rhodococcus erythropolis]